MAEQRKFIPKEYQQRGWFGNNTTIPIEEKRRIAESSVDLPEQEKARARYRAEMELHDRYVELGLAPENTSHGAWLEYEGLIEKLIVDSQLKPWERPLYEQRSWRGNGRLSKNQRNMDLFEQSNENNV